MANKHEHRIFHSGATEDPIVPVCSECGADLMVLYQEAEQQLAQARALLVGLADDLELECPHNPRSKEAYAFLAEHKEQSDGE